MAQLGLIFPPDQPPERLRAVAMAADAAGLPQLWLWEDCFAEGGIASAASALAWTSTVRVGLGLMPVPLRNVGLAAMEIATIERAFPGRFLPGIGHGVLEWMGQAGVRARSPLTLLREYATGLRRLLDGEAVTTSGRYVHLDDVQLRHPPRSRVPLLVGAEGPKTLALAGEVGDGIIFTGGTTPEQVRAGLEIAYAARRAAGREDPLAAVTFLAVPIETGADRIGHLASELAGAGADHVGVCALSPDGPPDGSDRLVAFAATLAQAQ